MAHWRSYRPPDPGSAAAVALCLLAAVLLWLCAGFLAAARAHDWYDGACCSGRDCFEVTRKAGTGEVTTTRTGYNVVIWRLPPQLGGAALDPPFQDHVVQSNTRRSQDELPHACLYIQSVMGGPVSWALRCLYVPDLGS